MSTRQNMVLNMDDLTYAYVNILFKYRSVDTYIDTNLSINDILENSILLYLLQKYVLDSRFIDLECFLDDEDAYYLYRYFSPYFNSWPEMEEKIRKYFDEKCWYEEYTGTRI